MGLVIYLVSIAVSAYFIHLMSKRDGEGYPPWMLFLSFTLIPILNTFVVIMLGVWLLTLKTKEKLSIGSVESFLKSIFERKSK